MQCDPAVRIVNLAAVGGRFFHVAALGVGLSLACAPGALAAAPNPLRIATLRWYEANQAGPSLLVGLRPSGLTFDGANVWVANFGGNSVTKLRALDGAILRVIPLAASPNDLAFDGSNIWVASFNGGTVTKLRARDGANVGSVAVQGANGVAFDGTHVWVTGYFGTVTKLTTDGVMVGQFGVGSGASGVAFDGADIWVAGFLADNVTKLRATDGAILGTFSVDTPYALAFDGANVWVTSRATSSVVKLRASDGERLGAFPVGAFPRGVVFDGESVWVANQGVFFDGNTVTKLRVSDGAMLGTFAVGVAPWGLVFDGVNVWVSNFVGNTISKR